MAVTVYKPNAKQDQHPTGKYVSINDGHLVINAAYDGMEGASPTIAIYAPDQWRYVVTDEEGK